VGVPPVVGLTSDQATRSLADAGLGIRVVTRPSDDPADVVIGQRPRAGAFVGDDTTVELLVSRGPPSVEIPEVTDLSSADARTALERAGFVVAETTAFDENVAAGSVIGTDPPVGTAVAPDSQVTMTVSEGPAPVQVPDVAGRTYDEAAQIVAGAHLGASRGEDQFSSTVEAGKVIGTNPPAGSSAPRDSAVAIVVSKGPELVEVPPLVGLTLEAAQAALQARGFEVDTVSYLPGRVVRSSNPAAGSKVGRGTKVTLTF
jgi:serine/threonine-protein kinase